MDDNKNVQNIFKSFAGGANEMDGRQFAKLAKDCNLLDKNFTLIDTDIVFAKVKSKKARKISFSQFDDALEYFAVRKGTPKSHLIEQIEETGGPKFQGTKPDFVKFHDDKNTYTGVYARGGPNTVDAGRDIISDISQLCDRSPANARGVKK